MSFASRTKCGQMVIFLKNFEVMHSLNGVITSICHLLIAATFLTRHLLTNDCISWGVVEDTKLEAKDTKKNSEAKDSLCKDKPSRGQGQECSRPRTQPHSQKNGLQKSFSGNLQFIGIARIFDWEGLNYKSHAMTSSKICLLALNQDFAKGEGLN